MKKIFWGFLGIIFSFFFYFNVSAEEVHLYLFYGDTCPICEEERSYLATLKSHYPELQIFEFETFENSKNAANMQEIKKMYKVSRGGVPFTVVGDTAILGFNDATRAKIESAIKKYEKEDYYDRVGVYLGLFEDEEIVIPISSEEENFVSSSENRSWLSIFFFVFVFLLFFLFFLFVIGKKRKKASKS